MGNKAEVVSSSPQAETEEGVLKRENLKGTKTFGSDVRPKHQRLMRSSLQVCREAKLGGQAAPAGHRILPSQIQARLLDLTLTCKDTWGGIKRDCHRTDSHNIVNTVRSESSENSAEVT